MSRIAESINNIAYQARMTNPQAGLPYDRKLCESLNPNTLYTITGVEIGAWETSIWLEGFNKSFNSVNFTFYINGEPVDDEWNFFKEFGANTEMWE